MGNNTRRDGRVEPGQKLSSAFSARAWNRAQDAADVVLGERTRFGAGTPAGSPHRIVVPCRVTTTSLATVLPGHVVEITANAAASAPNRVDAPPETFAPSVGCLIGQVAVPLALQDSRSASRKILGVIVGGAEMPTIGTSRIVDVCIAGLCVALVRQRSTASQQFGFISAPVMRRTGDTLQSLAGVAEQSDCGPYRQIATIRAFRDQANQPRIFYASVIL